MFWGLTTHCRIVTQQYLAFHNWGSHNQQGPSAAYNSWESQASQAVSPGTDRAGVAGVSPSLYFKHFLIMRFTLGWLKYVLYAHSICFLRKSKAPRIIPITCWIFHTVASCGIPWLLRPPPPLLTPGPFLKHGSSARRIDDFRQQIWWLRQSSDGPGTWTPFPIDQPLVFVALQSLTYHFL